MDNQFIMAISYFIQILFLALGLYYFVISIFAFIPRKEKERQIEKEHSFALLVAAYNEESVIENMVESLNTQNYPRDKYEIFVIADNCTDATASLAGAKGAQVFERFCMEKRGKGHALEWMFDQIFHMEREFDYVCVFDADNIVQKDFLLEMNKQADKGHVAIQGYIDSKNPEDSWVSYSYSIAFWTINKLFQQSRYNLGLGCQLCGTGFAVTTKLLKEMGWGATCLTEDMEFTMKLALNDVIVSWANDAIVYDEKPLTFSQSWKQRKRWMQGHADVASRFFFKLIKKSVKEKNLMPFDCAIYLLQPLRIVTMGVITIMGWIQATSPDSNLVVWGFVPTGIWSVVVVVQFAWGPLVLYTQGRFTKRTIWGYVPYIVYSLTWVPIAILGIANKNNKEWFHTQHTRKIRIEEMQ